MSRTRGGPIIKRTAHPEKATKRNKMQKIGDRAVIVEMLLKGQTLYAIHERINELRKGEYSLSYSQIVYDAKLVERQWVEEYLSDVNAAKAKELARVDKIERAAWEEWERSKRTLARTEKEQIENEQGGADGKAYNRHRKTRAKKIEQERDADRKFMEIVQWCVDTRCKILGLNAAQRYDISWKKQAQAAGVDPDKLQQKLVDEFVEAASKGLDNSDQSDTNAD